MIGAYLAGLRPRLLFFIWCASLLPMLMALLPFAAALWPDLAHQPKGAEIWHDDTYVIDLLQALFRERHVFAAEGAASVLVALLLAPAVSAAIVASLRGERVLAAAARDYGRQLRLSLLSLVPLALAAGCSAPAFVWLNKLADRALVETEVDHALMGAAALAVVFFSIAFAWGDCARVIMVRTPERIGAFRAFVLGTRLLFRRFLRVMMAYALVVLIAAGLAAALLVWRAHSQWLWLGQLVPLIFAWARTARVASVRASSA